MRGRKQRVRTAHLVVFGPMNSLSGKLIEVRDLQKTFTMGLLRKRVEAVKGVSFDVERGEIFGFLGPNGAGKTTTIKMLTGLIAPSGGSASLFGLPVPSAAARARIGFLPENPYVYPYLTPREFVAMCGRLSGLSGRALSQSTERVLDKTRILYAADRPVRRLSKGMLQRTGLAAALVADPELLILDEPMSGLDPVGRKEVRELIFAEREAGRTIFFSTHILSDVEAICDRVTILREGKVVVAGKLSDLLSGASATTEVRIEGLSESTGLAQDLAGLGRVVARGTGHVLSLNSETQLKQALQILVSSDARIVEVASHRQSLEELFMQKAV